MRETVKDLDFIISTAEPHAVREQLVSLPNVKDIIANGDTKVSVTLAYDADVSVDFRLVEDKALLQRCTILQDQKIIMCVCVN